MRVPVVFVQVQRRVSDCMVVGENKFLIMMVILVLMLQGILLCCKICHK
jgi:hypothetical protein